jgi:hypothetical protein
MVRSVRWLVGVSGRATDSHSSGSRTQRLDFQLKGFECREGTSDLASRLLRPRPLYTAAMMAGRRVSKPLHSCQWAAERAEAYNIAMPLGLPFRDSSSQWEAALSCMTVCH